MSHFYNEWDRYCASWLRNLQAEGHIPAGHVEEKSITELSSEDIGDAVQAHFFAGIAGWPLALKMAGWPEDRPVWTGSPPCQPFSSAGKKKGFADERHLAPAWMELVRQCRPPVIFGEQVADAIGQGWLDALFVELEQQGYACGAAVLPAVSVGAPHLRHRLFFVADSRSDAIWRVARAAPREEDPLRNFTERLFDRYDSEDGQGPDFGSPTSNFWEGPRWVPHSDGKYRPARNGTPVVDHGIPSFLGRVRAYGNAIVPQVAAKFIEAFLLSEAERAGRQASVADV